MARKSIQQRRGHRDRPDPDAVRDAADQPPSKTALKSQSHDLQKLGVALSELPADRRKGIDMPDDLREAIDFYLKTKAHGARKRQMQFIGKILRGMEVGPLREAVEAFKKGKAADDENLHKVERWRDALMADDEAITRWMGENPETDAQHLRSLIRAARRDHAALDDSQRQPRSYRELFQFIRRELRSQ